MSAKDMLGAVIRKILDLPAGMLGTISDLLDKLLGESGQEWLKELRKFLRKESSWAGVVAKKILRLISGGETLTIDASDGASVDDGTITWYFYDDCDKEGANEPCQPTKEVGVEVYEMVEDATFTKIFGSLSSDLQKVCFFSRDQVKKFAKKYREWLREEGFATFFLYKSTNGNFFVARVHVDSGGLCAGVDRFGDGRVWRGESRPRVVVPQL
ncbi:MAG TPA: hypothetical protein VMC41_04600 [Candidatus Nanoarchaeia archaeon]|nr:hypothetical protein [Candidatus Nanoarchaeia archaeon]